jgi:hypothetical protein
VLRAIGQRTGGRRCAAPAFVAKYLLLYELSGGEDKAKLLQLADFLFAPALMLLLKALGPEREPALGPG